MEVVAGREADTFAEKLFRVFCRVRYSAQERASFTRRSVSSRSASVTSPFAAWPSKTASTTARAASLVGTSSDQLWRDILTRSSKQISAVRTKLRDARSRGSELVSSPFPNEFSSRASISAERVRPRFSATRFSFSRSAGVILTPICVVFVSRSLTLRDVLPLNDASRRIGPLWIQCVAITPRLDAVNPWARLYFALLNIAERQMADRSEDVRARILAGKNVRVAPLAEAAGLSENGLRQAIAREEVTAVRVGNSVLIPAWQGALLLGIAADNSAQADAAKAAA